MTAAPDAGLVTRKPGDPPNVCWLSCDGALRSQLALAGPRPVVVDFSAAWCTKCKGVEPLVVALARAHPGLRFVVADADGCPDFAAACRFAPTFVVFKNGRRVDEWVGVNEHLLTDRVWLHAD